MIRFILSVVFLFAFQSSFAQQSIHEIAEIDGDKNWWKIKQGINVQSSSFFENYQQSMGFGPYYSFILQSEKSDNTGMLHSRYQQMYKGVAIEGAQFILHGTNSLVERANGNLVKNIQGSGVASLTFKEALNTAKKLTGASRFYWENPQMEALIKEARNNPRATFFPKEELVWIDPQFSQKGENYRLTYKLDLFFEAHDDHHVYYIDAHNGDLIWEQNKCHSGAAQGQAQTRYHGLRNITTDSLSPTKYVLYDDTRGNGIRTLNAQQNTQPASAVDFEDADNYWDNANAQMDDAATDAHWGAEATYDYFLNEHGRDSYDDLGSQIISYVHWDQAWFNASWNGIAMRYGDGNGNPLITIDIVGHELAHGVTEYSANLVYAYEPGALNESFSDIFGTALEFYTLGDSADWDMGKFDFHLRQLDNPKAFNDPDTYLGINWYTGSGDNGGVHINSGVQNYWFYLLSEGGTGINDLGHAYQVDSFGIKKAAEVAYNNLNHYLTPTSDYYDSRRGSIWAAEDLYGSCSYEANLIAKAWYAVGIGADTLSNDIEILAVNSPNNSCDLGSTEILEIEYVYFRSGCDSVIAGGDSIKFGYSINGGAPVVETLQVGSNINSGDTLTYTFTTTEDFTTIGDYDIDFWADYNNDFIADNDTIYDYSIKVLEPIMEDDSLGFELTTVAVEEPLYNLLSNDNGDIMLSVQARNTGLRGASMSARNTNLFGIDLPNDESGNFTQNHDQLTRICMCADASGMDNVTLEFDLRQTFSSIYSFFLGANAREIVSSLRVTVDGQQVGPQLHPYTNTQDTFATRYFSLDPYAGTQFELCLEGKHFLNRSEDPGNSQGDYSYVDNIKLSDYEYVSLDEHLITGIKVFPNPTSGLLNLNMKSIRNGEALVKVMDTKGMVIYEKTISVSQGKDSHSIDLSGKSKGIYLIQIQDGDNLITDKIILE